MHKITKFRHRRKAKLIELLGGKCVKCGSNQELDIDHIDPATKQFTLSGNNLNKKWDIVWAEAKKCQLLCKKHHKIKTSVESKKRRPPKHGTEWMYKKYKCRCTLCVEGFALIRKTYPSRKSKINPL